MLGVSSAARTFTWLGVRGLLIFTFQTHSLSVQQVMQVSVQCPMTCYPIGHLPNYIYRRIWNVCKQRATSPRIRSRLWRWTSLVKSCLRHGEVQDLKLSKYYERCGLLLVLI